jgi:hypothetical protein
MTRKSILAWALAWALALALSIVLAVALAEAEPAYLVPGLTPAEQYCRGLGLFAYRRTTERNLGYTLTDVMSQTRLFNARNNTDQTTRTWHESIVIAIYSGTDMTPTSARQGTEEYCLMSMTQQQPAPAPRQTTPDARLRY